MKKLSLCLTLSVFSSLPLTAQSADTQRQAEVAKLGADVMPFSLRATTHVFTKTRDGGTQRVVAKDDASDVTQVRLVREHLQLIQKQFQAGDFSGPSYIHGNEMPGLAQLKAAKPGQISITYMDVARGGELSFRTTEPSLVSALHAWFDTQVSDHGADAMEGHAHHHGAHSQD
ncbi:aspartate carbamoyltransferase [Cupriavidus sp. WKF15]|uniref:aspartate carbamoyltransferase n=1 Tax=Cupriavidus sp. WKF15 TaxID=3032282 RepID=UPI0023E327CA|nr:aspartate carbamoyltransferase [Cupriavidus sp. WKF15]WER50289.1 aspartate carbamoyltransferase [Cupriavidus sp. WKF15]